MGRDTFHKTTLLKAPAIKLQPLTFLFFVFLFLSFQSFLQTLKGQKAKYYSCLPLYTYSSVYVYKQKDKNVAQKGLQVWKNKTELQFWQSALIISLHKF